MKPRAALALLLLLVVGLAWLVRGGEREPREARAPEAERVPLAAGEVRDLDVDLTDLFE